MLEFESIFTNSQLQKTRLFYLEILPFCHLQFPNMRDQETGQGIERVS